MTSKAIEWANNQVEELKNDLKYGEKWKQIQAKVKLNKINTLTEEEYGEAAIASYQTYLQRG